MNAAGVPCSGEAVRAVTRDVAGHVALLPPCRWDLGRDLERDSRRGPREEIPVTLRPGPAADGHSLFVLFGERGREKSVECRTASVFPNPNRTSHLCSPLHQLLEIQRAFQARGPLRGGQDDHMPHHPGSVWAQGHGGRCAAIGLPPSVMLLVQPLP